MTRSRRRVWRSSSSRRKRRSPSILRRALTDRPWYGRHTLVGPSKLTCHSLPDVDGGEVRSDVALYRRLRVQDGVHVREQELCALQRWQEVHPPLPASVSVPTTSIAFSRAKTDWRMKSKTQSHTYSTVLVWKSRTLCACLALTNLQEPTYSKRLPSSRSTYLSSCIKRQRLALSSCMHALTCTTTVGDATVALRTWRCPATAGRG